MPRTVESTVFEIMAAVLLVAMWVMAAHLMEYADEDHGRKYILLLSIGATAVVAFSLFRAYYPEMLKSEARFLPKQKTARQYQLLCRMSRVLAVELVPTAMLAVLSVANHGWAETASLCCALLIAATGICYSFKLRRAA